MLQYEKHYYVGILCVLHRTAPEVKDRNRFYKESDVWSYGVTLWEIFSDARYPIIRHDPDPDTKIDPVALSNHAAFVLQGERLVLKNILKFGKILV